MPTVTAESAVTVATKTPIFMKEGVPFPVLAPLFQPAQGMLAAAFPVMDVAVVSVPEASGSGRKNP